VILRQQSKESDVHPPIARQASVQGVVTLRVTTDGKRIARFDAESSPPYLVLKTKDNVCGTEGDDSHALQSFGDNRREEIAMVWGRHPAFSP
jgi:hypothetical protein